MPILALWVALAAAVPAHPVLMPNGSQAAPGVIVRLGTASLEEYRHGNPNARIQLLRECAQ